MRAHVFIGVVLGSLAAFVASAVALAQAPTMTPPPAAVALDAGAPTATPTPTPTDAGVPTDAGDNAIEAVTAIRPRPTDSPDASAAAAEAPPSNVGFSVGLHVGYSIPFGTANGSALTGVLQGAVPVGVNVGWFLDPHLYIGGYFSYGFAIATELNNDECSDPDENCSATLLRFGLVAHYHFRPDALFDPWVGGGLGYDIINLEAEDQTAGTLDESGALHGFDLTIETGVDWKPLSYVGIGPYMELASGHYSSDASATSLHEWLSFGLRMRTNL